MYRFLTIILLFVLCNIKALPSIPEIKFRHYTMDDGLSSNRIGDIMQDKYGYIWFGTQDGLNRYDGVNMVAFRYDKKEKSSIGNNNVACLYEGEECVYVGTYTGVYVYRYATNDFLLLSDKIKVPILRIKGDFDGNLWIATDGKGIYRYNLKSGHIDNYPFTSSRGIVSDMVVDSENMVWTITNQGTDYLFRLNKRSNNFEPVSLKYDRDNVNSASVSLFCDSKKNMWIGTWQDGLQKLDIYQLKATTYLYPTQVKGTMHIHSIIEYAPDELLVGSDDGLVYFNTITQEYKLFTQDEANVNSLSNRFIYPMIKDKEGGIWIGTYHGGVNYIAPNNTGFRSFSHSKHENSVGGNVISRFCEDKKGNIWIASDDGGLSRMDKNTGAFTQFTHNNSGNSISFNNLHALCVDGNDLWIGTYSAGLNRYDMTAGKFKSYVSTGKDGDLDDNSCYDIFKDRDNNIWVSTMLGINRYRRASDDFEKVNIGALTIDISQDSKGNLWLSTQGKGLVRYNPYTKKLKRFTASEEPNSLPNNQINCTYINNSDEIYVGTMEGLCKYNPKDESFSLIWLNIPSNNICSITEDQNVLWLTTSQGLVKYIPNEGCQLFTKSDGLLCNQFLPNSAFKASDGKIYIGSFNGFNVFSPYQIHTNKIVPRVVFSGLEIFNKDVKIGSDILPKDLNMLDELNLSYKDNVISINYSALSYCVPSKNQYAYMLEGFDKDWNYVGSQHKATYTNLRAGTYIFRVKATNNDGEWNDDETTLKIIIHPPFYLTTSFYIIYLILIIFSVVILVKFFLNRSEKEHNEEINRLNESKEREMHEAKIKFFTMIAHEIRTPVSLIIAPLEKIMGSLSRMPIDIKEDINIIDRNSHRLLFLVNQLLDFRKVEKEGITLKCSLCNINELINTVSSRFASAIEQDGVKFIVKLPEKPVSAIVDSEALTKLISNLLSNAKKYTNSSIELECTSSAADGYFKIICRDNGLGISKDEQEKIFTPFYQVSDNKPGTGLGLSLVKEIVEAHNGSVEVESEEGNGSAFIVTLPYERKDDVVSEVKDDISEKPEPDDIISDKETLSDKEKINLLIVDDNRDMLSFLSLTLGTKYNILTAEDGVEALNILQNYDISFIVSDWMMPNMDGAELCKAVRANVVTSHIPFLLLTAKSDVNSKIEGMDCGADIYIEKPFSVQYLEACIRNIADMRVMLMEKFSTNPLSPLKSIASNGADEKFLKRLNALIEDNFANSELTVDFLVEHLNISRSGLFTKIKTLANVTPNELIQMVRLKKAAAMILQQEYRINEISYMVGFNSPSYFTRCFQKQFGMNPKEFLNNHIHDDAKKEK